jgi:hypothetical protein
MDRDITIHKGKVRITFKALGAMMGLPEDARITAIDASDAWKEILYVCIERLNLPEWREGEEIEVVSLELVSA